MFPGSLVNSPPQNSNIFLSYPCNAISTHFQYQIKPIHPHHLIPGYAQMSCKTTKEEKKDIKDLSILSICTPFHSSPIHFLSLPSRPK
ncbi:hypothetical protein EYC80_004118 [Monilinia laxa]|uniref:Uncharacterized protein n=1 Tax=Monilinia laxa TaxID=61186 RepID=A0A5N6KNT4_MONLA|nr:hypothetical protein EYC80_004118 [Monilinia laxa]